MSYRDPADPLCIRCRHKRSRHGKTKCYALKSTGGGHVSKCLCDEFSSKLESARARVQQALDEAVVCQCGGWVNVEFNDVKTILNALPPPLVD